MDIEWEEEFRIELEESTDEDDKKVNIHLEPILKLEEIQERNCYGSIDMKSEIEVKEEPFAIEEEEAGNDELLDKIFRFDQNRASSAILLKEKRIPKRKYIKKQISRGSVASTIH